MPFADKIADVLHALGLTTAALGLARARHRLFRRRANRYHVKVVHAQRRADKARADGRSRAARRGDRAAHLNAVRSRKNADKARWWVGRIKHFVQAKHRLEVHHAELERLAEKWRKAHKLRVSNNKVTGGTGQQRLRLVALTAAARCAHGTRRNFYSNYGAFDAHRAITGERYGERSDCSSWFIAAYWSAGLPAPDHGHFTGGYTGSLDEHGRIVAHPEPGDAILYGPRGATHHVELYVGPGNRTIGHGTAEINAGIVDLFGDGVYHIRRYV